MTDEPQVIYPVSMEPNLTEDQITRELARRYAILALNNPGCVCKIETWRDAEFPFKQRWRTEVKKELVEILPPVPKLEVA